MLPLEIREQRFRLQQQLTQLEDGPDKQALQDQIAALQQICEHTHPEESPEKGWRCRDCDLRRPPEPTEEPVQAASELQPAAVS